MHSLSLTPFSYLQNGWSPPAEIWHAVKDPLDMLLHKPYVGYCTRSSRCLISGNLCRTVRKFDYPAVHPFKHICWSPLVYHRKRHLTAISTLMRCYVVVDGRCHDIHKAFGLRALFQSKTHRSKIWVIGCLLRGQGGGRGGGGAPALGASPACRDLVPRYLATLAL